ncbi:phenylalanine--tRNA ligase subunit beta [Agarilytica rhodophyticola]|uniref:phenylalanine--tRNA ligase subunit beta n=1 Tax=Agarilytica rhodophyticola TaxID=1737490 RepID=UPI000B345EDB|nr:phenylalanine--tRNA ligase subunit beta [Agarilytica rhodophyticola]
MKISEAWLREWVNPEISTQELVDQITMAGLEVDSVEAVAGEFSNVVVGEILSAEQHPDADKLKVCRVAGSPEGDMQVVCGAPNARPGIKIPFALVGAKLPGDFKIKKAKLRGVESFGMLCAQTELQVGDDNDGLWELPTDAPTGQDLREYLSLDDKILEVDLTPNRGDCLSLRGLAREVGVLNKAEVTAPCLDPVSSSISDTKAVTLSASEACSRYVGRVIKNIDISKSSPLWLQEKLRRCGLRSIDPVVDITNYVLIELGQPMHAFDLDKLSGGINVRMAEQDEDISLLDGQDIKLNDDTLVIADDSGAIAMAGIMGGASTAVSENTRNIFLESAFFNPLAVAGRARSYGLHTDSSHRFERGVDYQEAHNVLERATQLVLDIVGGEAGPTVVVDSDALPQPKSVTLSRKRIESGLGMAMEASDVEDIFDRLGFLLEGKDNNGWSFKAPSYRFDVAIEEDLLEELARIYGYNRLPIAPVKLDATLPRVTETQVSVSSIERQLVGRGYQEVITYSFIDPKLQKMFDDKSTPTELLNPISADMAVMRTSIVPGLVSTLLHNINRQKSRVRIFEKGLRFIPDANGLQQTRGLSGLIYGARAALDWNADKRDVDFYDIKGDVESILSFCGKPITFQATQRTALHPGQTAEILIEDKVVGYIGALHPGVTQELEIPKSVYVFELTLDDILESHVAAFEAISKFPEVSRDLAVLVPRELPVSELEICITRQAGEYLKNLKVFDVYSGEGIDPQRKSVAFNLTFQHPSRTLNEEEINNPMASVVKRLEEQFDARLR